MDKYQNWKLSKADGKFLFAVKAISEVYRAKYVALLRSSDLGVKHSNYDALFKKPWVVYAKRPFGSPASVVECLGRYTHKIAISNHWILAMDDLTVTISYKDYRAESQKKTMTLPDAEFICRFALHILPKRLIRHYGFLSATWKRKKLAELQARLTEIISSKLLIPNKAKLHKSWPCCKTGHIITIMTFGRRDPPSEYFKAEAQKHASLVSI